MKSSRRRAVSGTIGGLLFLLSARLFGATYTVTTTADSGQGSLRQAILDANANAGADVIAFQIPASGVQTIAPLTALPPITESLTIDGYTQPGASPNTLGVGDDAVLLIEISGVNGSGGLKVQPAGVGNGWTTIRGLVLDDGAGVFFDDSAGGNQGGQNVLAGCFLGVSPDGSSARPPSGVVLRSWSNTVGGLAPADRNVIAGGILGSEASKGNSVTNNYIGTDVSGTVALGVDGGVSFGDSTPFFSEQNSVSGNLISGNTGTAVFIGGGTGNTVSNNLIGTDATGTLPLGNGADGVHVWTGAGIFGTNRVLANTIAFNAGTGVSEGGTIGAVVSGNSIHDNGGLGIASSYLASPPTLSTATTVGTTTTIHGSTIGMGGTVALEFFLSPTCDPSGFGEGTVPLGTASVAAGTDFTVTVPAVAPGAVITATSTSFETSGFSACVLVTDGGPTPTILSIAPASGPAVGGTALALAGLGFLPGALASVGGADAGGTVASETEMSAVSPALAPGTLDDVTVTNRNGSTATLLKAWFADFTDVAQDDPFHASIEGIFRAGITAGCGNGLYCRDDAVRRDQVAVFLLKAEHGSSYMPPGCTGVFGDVACPGPFADWIERLAAEGITTGCGSGNYCPQDPVRRDQMAVLLLKTKHGAGYAPPPCAGVFGDVDCPSTFADWIEQLGTEDITAGCGGGNYCPSKANTRGQMAVFLLKTFGLPL